MASGVPPRLFPPGSYPACRMYVKFRSARDVDIHAIHFPTTKASSVRRSSCPSCSPVVAIGFGLSEFFWDNGEWLNAEIAGSARAVLHGSWYRIALFLQKYDRQRTTGVFRRAQAVVPWSSAGTTETEAPVSTACHYFEFTANHGSRFLSDRERTCFTGPHHSRILPTRSGKRFLPVLASQSPRLGGVLNF